MQKKRLIAIAGPVLAVSGIWYVGIERPTNHREQEQTTKLATSSNQLAALKRQLQTAKASTVEQADIDAAQAAVNVQFPVELGLGEFILQSEQAAAATGITVTAIDTVTAGGASPVATKPAVVAPTTTIGKTAPTTAKGAVTTAAPTPAAARNTTNTGGVTTTPLQIVARGEAQHLVDYVQRLQTMERIVLVDNVHITNDGKGSAELTLAVNLYSRPGAA